MTTEMTESTLYSEIGGDAAIDALVEDFYPRVEADEELKDFFAKTDMTKQRNMMKSFLTVVTGGPNNYSGKSMKAAHKGRGIELKHFMLVAGHLSDSLKSLNVDSEHHDTIMEAAAGLKDDVVSA